ncbi:MAG: hypothetical protein AAF993_17755 [Pseudomonadota bacterium]
MNLEQLANLGEFIGAIAVIASVIYLAIQIKQNTQSVKSSTLATNTAIWTNMLIDLASDEKAEAYLNGAIGREDIEPKQLLQFVQISRAMLVSFETQHHQYLTGALDKNIYLGYERACREQMLVFPGFQMIWDITRNGFSPAFAELVDRIISEINEGESFHITQQWQALAAQRKAGTRTPTDS